jgi:hypothetical protein
MTASEAFKRFNEAQEAIRRWHAAGKGQPPAWMKEELEKARRVYQRARTQKTNPLGDNNGH